MESNSEYSEMGGQISLSLMCNIRHKFCFQPSFSTNRLSDEIIYEKLKPLYERMATLRILGGEPTIIPGIKDYLSWLRESYPQMEIELVTNGIAFDKEWLLFVDTHRIKVQVSVNGITQEVFNKIMLKGNPVLLRQTLFDNLKELIEKNNMGHEPILNCISMVVNEDTKADLEEFVLYGLTNGVNLSLQFPNSADMQISAEYEKIAEQICKFKYFCEEFIDIITYSVPEYIKNRINKQIKYRSLETEKSEFLVKAGTIKKSREKGKIFLYCHDHDYKDVCQMPLRGVSIMPDGFVYPCNNTTNYPLGNLYFDSIEEIMTTEKRQNLQAMLNAGNHKYCFKRCQYNRCPDTSQDNAKLVYSLPYKELFECGEYEKSAEAYAIIEKTSLYRAVQMYEHAFCLHIINKDINKSIELYTKALKNGFDEFWVKYNRADAYIRIGEMDKAKEDIIASYSLNSEHEGVRQLYERYILQEKS